MKNTVLLNVCILPPELVAKQCIAISNTFNENDVRFMLGDRLFPHTTVYMARFEESRIDEVKSRLKSLVSNLNSVKLTHTGYYLTEGDYIEVSYQRTSELLEFHSEIIAALKDYRAHPGDAETESYFGPYNAAQKKNAQETGYDLAYDLYRPHITLTRYKEGRVPYEFPAFPAATLSFDIPKIALYKADENGAVYEEIATLEIS